VEKVGFKSGVECEEVIDAKLVIIKMICGMRYLVYVLKHLLRWADGMILQISLLYVPILL